jgi:hypothetical protein
MAPTPGGAGRYAVGSASGWALRPLAVAGAGERRGRGESFMGEDLAQSGGEGVRIACSGVFAAGDPS